MKSFSMLLQLLESRTLLSAGDLDTSFGSSGLVFTSVPSIPYQLQATSLAVQNDGKILAAGFGFCVNELRAVCCGALCQWLPR